MSAPEIPPEARSFLRYLPMIAEYIRTNRRPSQGELSLLRMFLPDAFRQLRELTYERIVAMVSPYESHPEVGVYVRLVKTEQGRAWIEDVLARIKSM